MVKFTCLLRILSTVACASAIIISRPKPKPVGECKELVDKLVDNEDIVCNLNDDNKIDNIELYANITQNTLNEISNYKTLTILRLVRTEVSHLDFEVLNNENVYFYDLKRVNLVRENKFKGRTLPPNVIKTLKNINHVSIIGYQIQQETLDALSTLTNTGIIYMADCGFDKDLDFSVLQKDKKLSNLTLDGYNKAQTLEKFPKGVCQLKNLKTLDMHNHDFTTIPSCITNLRKLNYLKIAACKITNLPDYLSRLTKLETLDLTNNQIDATIPSSYNRLNNLVSIDLDSNVDIRGKTLTNPKLEVCDYNLNSNGSANGICVAKGTKCIPSGLPDC